MGVVASPGFVELLAPYANLILPTVFVGFFLVTLVAIVYADNRHIRQAYVAGLVLTLLLFQTVMPVYVTPFINWHKFSEPRPVETTDYSVYLVDANGQELELDRKATLAFNGIRMVPVERMLTEYSESKNEAIAEWLIERATEYRVGVERDQPRRGAVPADVRDRPLQLLRFPAHSVGAWTPDDVADYDEFVGIRAYKVTTVTSSDGSEIRYRVSELVLEVYPDGQPVVADGNQTRGG